MAAGNLDILVEQGATFSMRLVLSDSVGSGIDLTGWTFRGQIRSKYDSGTILASFTATIDPDQVTNPGAVDFEMADTVTEAITVLPATNYNKKNTPYAYDIEGEDPDGNVYRIVQGVANISPEVTR